MNVAILNSKKTVGNELSLECNVTTVKGISSSSVLIMWLKNGTTVEETNDNRITIFQNNSTNIYSSILQFSYLSEDDESEYTCSVMIHDARNFTSIELNNFDSMFIV